jgi:hypothetical protein
VYTPMIQLILFSGIFWCGVLPVLGGRFYTVQEDNRRNSVRDHSTGVLKVCDRIKNSYIANCILIKCKGNWLVTVENPSPHFLLIFMWA